MNEIDFLKKILITLAHTEVLHVNRIKMKKEGRRKMRWWAEYHAGRQQITIFKHDDYLGRVASVIHELLHACYPEKTEAEVVGLTDEIAKAVVLK